MYAFYFSNVKRNGQNYDSILPSTLHNYVTEINKNIYLIHTVFTPIDTTIFTELWIDIIYIYAFIGTVDKDSGEIEFHVFDILASNTDQSTYTTGHSVN